MSNGKLYETRFKLSAVTCRGTGVVMKNGFMVSMKCPSPKACQEDVLYNAMIAGPIVAHENATVEEENMNVPAGFQK